MGEPRAITYSQVKKAFKTDSEAAEAWRDICTITGAGNVPAGDYASIDITELVDGKVKQIDKVLTPDTPVEDKKTGGK